MTPFQLLFLIMLISAVGAAMRFGSQDEVIGAVAVVLAALLTPIAHQAEYARAEVGILVVDLMLCATFLWLALRSRRFWPMWAAGLQLSAISVHLAVAKIPYISPGAYAETLAIFSFPVLVVLLLGSLVEARRSRGRVA